MKFIYVQSTYPLFLGVYLKQKGENVCFLYTRQKYKEVIHSLNIESQHIKLPTYNDYFLRPGFVKRKIYEVNQIIGTNDLIFTHVQFAVFLFVLLFNRLKKSRSIFYNYEPLTRNTITIIDRGYYFKDYILALIWKNVLKFFFRTETVLSLYNKTFFLSINHNYFDKCNVVNAKVDINFEKLQFEVLRNIQFNHPSIDNLYVTGSEIQYKDKLYDTNSIDDIVTFVENNNISVKPHPSGYPYPKSKSIISPYIPTEFLFKVITHSIISINSTTLIAASNYYEMNSSVKIICLLKLVKYLDKESYIEMLNRILSRSKNNILFPETIQELILILGS